jgi:acyl-coenzyme A thioesterase PaaI-like protein
MEDPSGWVNEFGILHGCIWACMAEVAASRVIAERNPDLTTSSSRRHPST